MREAEYSPVCNDDQKKQEQTQKDGDRRAESLVLVAVCKAGACTAPSPADPSESQVSLWAWGSESGRVEADLAPASLSLLSGLASPAAP